MNAMVKFQLQFEWTAPFKEIRVPCSGKLLLLKKKKKCLNERKPSRRRKEEKRKKIHSKVRRSSEKMICN